VNCWYDAVTVLTVLLEQSPINGDVPISLT
jgi:hypothetical protein